LHGLGHVIVREHDGSRGQLAGQREQIFLVFMVVLLE
jgi:hypothetical protein